MDSSNRKEAYFDRKREGHISNNTPTNFEIYFMALGVRRGEREFNSEKPME
jgi:hypothetical protein